MHSLVVDTMIGFEYWLGKKMGEALVQGGISFSQLLAGFILPQLYSPSGLCRLCLFSRVFGICG